MEKKIYIFIFLFLFLILNSTFIIAPGISGAVLERLFFEPGLDKTYIYSVNSNTIRPMDHYIDMNGDLCSYFTLSTDNLENLAPGEIRTFEAHMKLPQEFEPGEHRCYICATEAEGRTPEGMGSSIGTKVRVCAVIIIIAPYPGKKVEFSFNVDNVAKGENATFLFDVFNIGTEELDVGGVVDVFSKDIKVGKETKIFTLKTIGEHTVSGEKAFFNVTYNTSEMEIGEYLAKGTLHYDGLQEIKEKTFRVGELNIEILEFTEEVSQNKLNPINVKVKSKWNGDIKDVYASIDITHPEKNIIVASINTAPANLGPWEEKNLVAYWDTTGIEIGGYDVKVTLHYEDKITIKQGIIKVKEFALGPSISFTAILLFILIIVVLLLIILIISMMKRMQKQKRPIPIKKRKIKK